MADRSHSGQEDRNRASVAMSLKKMPEQLWGPSSPNSARTGELIITQIGGRMSGFVGIDVSKAHLDLAVGKEGEVSRLGNDENGIRQFVTWLQEIQPDLIVVESTGGLERVLVTELYIAHLPVSLVNPGRVREFA
jgi:hypothetical protein